MTKRKRPIARLFESRRRGVVMVLVLWLIIVLAVMAYSLAYEMRLGLKTTTHAQKRLKALGLARLGLAKAVVDLKNDRLVAFNNPEIYNDTLDDIWAKLDDKLEIDGEDEEGQYSVIVRDENRKIDLNSIQLPSAGALSHIFEEVCGMREKDAKQLAFAVIDYRDADAKPAGGEGDDEFEFYTEYGLKQYADLLPADWFFRPKNDDFQTLDELLMIPGITREMLYGNPDEMEMDPFERAESEEESTALADYLTVGSGLTVNVNTASPMVLAALVRALNISSAEVPGIARQIEQLRSGRSRIKENDLSGITNLAQLRDAGLSEEMVNALQALIPLDVRSKVFTIIARGEYLGVRETLEARVSLNLESYQIDPDNPDLLGTRDEAAIGLLRNQPEMRVDPAVRLLRGSTL